MHGGFWPLRAKYNKGRGKGRSAALFHTGEAPALRFAPREKVKYI